MKKFYSFLIAALALLTFISQPMKVWADTAGFSVNGKPSNVTNGSSTSGNLAGLADETWSWSSTHSSSSPYHGTLNNAWQIGKNGDNCTALSFTTSGILGTITEIKVTCWSYNGAKVSATVGGNGFGTQNQQTSNSSNVYTFTGEASGTIIVSFTNTSRYIAIKSIEVTYNSGGGGGGDTPTLTNISDITTADTYAVKGTVVAKSAYGMVIGDGTGYIYYANGYTSPSQNVNDVITIVGSVTEKGPSGSYAKAFQFTNTTSTITTATDSGYDGTPGVTIITDALPFYETGSHLSNYYQFTGVLACDASGYYNVQFGDKHITISNPHATTQKPTLNNLLGEAVRVKGYFAEINNRHDFTIVMESLELYNDPSAPEYEWVETAITDLTADDIFVIVGTTSAGATYALPSVSASSSPLVVAVTVEDDAITSDVAPSLKWRITSSSSGYTFNQNGYPGNYLYCTNSNTGVRVGSNTANNTFIIESGYLKNTSQSRYLGIYSDNNVPKDWRCYDNISGNTANQTFAFYKRQIKTNDPTITASPSSITDFNYTVGGGPSVNFFTVGGKNLGTYVITVALKKGTDFELALDENTETWSNSLTLTPTSGTVANTPIYVRMKAGLEEGDYTDNVNVTYGSLSKTISLSGTVNPVPVTYTYTAASSITPGKRYVIVGFADSNWEQPYAMAVQKANNRGAVSVASYYDSEKDEFSIPSNAGVYEFVISGDGTNLYSVYDTENNGYLYATQGSNYLNQKEALTVAGKWTITNGGSIDNMVISVTFNNNNSSETRKMRFNYTSDNQLFSCYTSGQKDIYLYERTDNNCDIYSATNIDSDMTVAGDMNIHAGVVTVKEDAVLTVNGSLTNTNPANLIIEDGGQLIHSNEGVTATVEKSISPYTNLQTEGEVKTNGWYFIASPVMSNYTPAGSMIANTYDLYRLNPASGKWENFKNTTDHPNFTTLNNGAGYLYANSEQTTLGFTGTLKPFAESQTVSVSTGWNLIGNPFAYNVYANRSFYKMNEAKTGVEAVSAFSTSPIAPCTGIVVDAATNGNVTFSKEVPAQSQGSNASLQIALSQVVEPDPAALRQAQAPSTLLDNAIVSFNKGTQLGKFYFGTQNANLYIPQGTEEYAIVNAEAQGETPVNFKANQSGEYTININTENVEMNYLHLIDNLTGNDVDLLATPSYTFNAKTDDYASRFRLVFSANNANNGNENDHFAFISNGQIVLTEEGNAQVFDVMGRMVSSHNNVNHISTEGLAAGVYVIRLTNGSETMTQKIVVK